MKSILIALVLLSIVHGKLIVSELERNPIGPETESPGGKSHEYVELVNLSNDTFVISELSLFDGATSDQVIPKSNATRLLPGSVLLILDPDYFLQDTPFPNAIDSSAIVATVNHVSICGGLSESDGFRVDYRGEVVASCYDSINDDGKLLFSAPVKESEPLVLGRHGYFLDQPWREMNCSPGSINGLRESIYLEYVTTASLLRFSHRTFTAAGSVPVRINGESVKIVPSGIEMNIDSVQLPDSLISVDIEITANGITRIEKIDLSKIRIPSGAIQFSEVAPRGEIEWIELKNRGNQVVDLEGWKIYNSEDSVTLPSIRMAPGEYAVLSDSPLLWPIQSTEISLFSLDNYRDTLRIDSPLGKMDSICWDYTKLPKWTTETVHRTVELNGFSEKAVRLGTPTPGATTSLVSDDTPFTLKVKPELFTPNGDGQDDSLLVATTSPSGWSCSIRIFDSRGIEQYRNDSVGMKLFWNGVSAAGFDVRRGPLIVLAEFSQSGQKTITQRTGVVLWR